MEWPLMLRQYFPKIRTYLHRHSPVRICLLLVLFYSLLHILYLDVINSKVEEISVSTDGTNYSSVRVPFSNKGDKKPEASYLRIRLLYLPWQSSPDLPVLHRGCPSKIAINGKNYPELASDEIPCRKRNSLVPHIERHLSAGMNTIDIAISSKNGSYRLAPNIPSTSRAIFGVVDRILPHFLFEALILLIILLHFRVQSWVVAVVLCSVFLNVVVYAHSTVNYYSPDIVGHKRYITYLVNHSYMPPPTNDMHRQHPPLYYEWEALAYTIGDMLSMDPWAAVRFASGVLYLVYLIFAVLFIEQFTLPKLAKFAALSLVLFIPDNNMIAGRVNNDIGFMAFAMPAFYFLQRWYTTLKPQYLGRALICSGISITCKATGLLALTTIGVAAMLVWLKRRISTQYFISKLFAVPYGIVGACLAVYFGRIAYYKWVDGIRSNWFENAGGMHPADAYNIFFFDVPDFIQSPISFGETFLNYYFHTLLYGDQFVLGPQSLMSTINALWVVIFALCIIQIIRGLIHRAQMSQYLIPLLVWWVLLLGQVYQRVLTRDHHLSAARYTPPVVVMMGLYLASFMKDQLEKGSTMFYGLVSSVVMAFAALSVVLVLIRVI